MSRFNLLRKLYNWFLLAGLFHHHFRIQSSKTKEEEGETGKLYKKRTQSMRKEPADTPIFPKCMALQNCTPRGFRLALEMLVVNGCLYAV